MSRFIQLHLLTSYPPSNLNRDDLGRPKTAMMGGHSRLRISSQSLKRAWRTSDVFTKTLKEHIGKRTKEIGKEVFKKIMQQQSIKEKDAKNWAKKIIEQFGDLEKTDSKKKEEQKSKTKENETDELKDLKFKQLVHISPEEVGKIYSLAEAVAKRNSEPTKEELSLLQEKSKAVDIAMFGRMLASNPKYNMEAAVQVAHAISVHSVAVEDDFFTAVDDLNKGEEDAGSAHLGITEFSAGLFYLYICIDKTSLIENLSDSKELADKTLKALVETSATVAPTGKQNSFASRARASYIRCETGDQQPRSLSVAFLEPIEKGNMLETAIKKLEETAENMNKVYGKCFEKECFMNVANGEGSLKKIIECITS